MSAAPKQSAREGISPDGTRTTLIAPQGLCQNGLQVTGISVESLIAPAGESPAIQLTSHTVGWNLGPSRRVEYPNFSHHGVVEIPPGGASFFPAGSVVSARWQESASFALLALDPKWLNQALGDEALQNGQWREALSLHDRRLELHLRSLTQEARRPLLANEAAVSALATLVGVDLIRLLHPEHRMGRGPERLTPRQVDRVRERIRSHWSTPPTLSDLAAEVGLSQFHFARAFRQTVGVSPGQFVRRERIEAAKERLERGGQKLQEIATDLGFATPSHFAQTFRSLTGLTPREYRESSQEFARTR